MKVWDFIESEAFRKANSKAQIWYSDGSLGYVRLGYFTQMERIPRTILVKKDGKTLIKQDFLNEPLLMLDYELTISVDGIVPLTTQNCVVSSEDCGIVIKERDIV